MGSWVVDASWRYAMPIKVDKTGTTVGFSIRDGSQICVLNAYPKEW
jgi:hypothetical protein